MPLRLSTACLLLPLLLAVGHLVYAQALDPSDYTNINGNTRVVVQADATQSYELYIPPGAQAPYHMVYGSVQTGQGNSLLLLLAEAAAEQGWAVAGRMGFVCCRRQSAPVLQQARLLSSACAQAVQTGARASRRRD